jgi:hypothetical protein
MAKSTKTVEGGNEALNDAIVIAEQLAVLIPMGGILFTVGENLIRRLVSNGGVDEATVERAREAIAKLRLASVELTSLTTNWLDTHPPEDESGPGGV